MAPFLYTSQSPICLCKLQFAIWVARKAVCPPWVFEPGHFSCYSIYNACDGQFFKQSITWQAAHNENTDGRPIKVMISLGTETNVDKLASLIYDLRVFFQITFFLKFF